MRSDSGMSRVVLIDTYTLSSTRATSPMASSTTSRRGPGARSSSSTYPTTSDPECTTAQRLLIDQSINRSIDQSIDQSNNQLIDRSLGRSVSQSINQSVSQPVS